MPSTVQRRYILNLYDQKKENKSLTTIIFDKIREDIINHVYQTGDKIVEAKLAEQLGVSRTPVREALKQLEQDGLVENIPNRGVVVKGVSKQDIADIYTIRQAIEGIATQWCIERITPKQIKHLKEIYELMEFYTAKGDVDKVCEYNFQFHENIYQATGSRYLKHVLSHFHIFIQSTTLRSLRSPGRLQKALQEHQRILQAIIDKDSRLAKQHIEQHVANSLQNIRLLNKE